MVPHPRLGHVWEQETRVTSHDDLVSKKGAPSTSTKLQCLAKYTRKLFQLKVETGKLVSPLETKAHLWAQPDYEVGDMSSWWCKVNKRLHRASLEHSLVALHLTETASVDRNYWCAYTVKKQLLTVPKYFSVLLFDNIVQLTLRSKVKLH